MQTVRHGGVNHARDGVMPKILLIERPLALAFFLVNQNTVAGMSATHAGCLHAARSGQIGRAEAQTMHSRAGAADGFDVGHALSRFEKSVQQNRFLDRVLGFE